jgi:hypothetical protein
VEHVLGRRGRRARGVIIAGQVSGAALASLAGWCLALCYSLTNVEILVRLSRYVYGGNRSFAPILRQSQWSLLYDVYWLVLMMVCRVKILYAPNLKFQKGVMSGVMRLVMNENQKSQSHVHVTALRCLRVKPGKRGLNSRLWPILRGGGAGSHTLPYHVTGNRWSTRHSRWVITLRPGALLDIFLIFHTIAVHPTINCTLLFVTGEDDIARFDSRRYSWVREETYVAV